MGMWSGKVAFVTGGGSGHHDEAYLRSLIREEERVQIAVRTGSLFALGLWGPRARDVLAAVTDVDVSNEAFPYLTARYLSVGEVTPVWAQRISYAGELGWELYGQIAMGRRAWDVLWQAGREHGLVAAGGPLQLSLFDEKDMAEIASPDYPGERLIVCRNPLPAAERVRKREELLVASEKALLKIQAATTRPRSPLRGAANIALKVGAVLGRRKVGKHFTLTITEDTLAFARNQAAIAAEAALDGFLCLAHLG